MVPNEDICLNMEVCQKLVDYYNREHFPFFCILLRDFFYKWLLIYQLHYDK